MQKVIFPQIPEFKISMKYKYKPSELYEVRSSKDVAHIARECFDADSIAWTESFVVMSISSNGKLTGFYKISNGGLSSTTVDPKVIFQFALLANASSIIIAHNHPSGKLDPSEADKKITARINEAANIFDIKLLDHVIVTSEDWYSFADNGHL